MHRKKKNQTYKEGKKASNDRTAEQCRGDTGNSAVNEKGELRRLVFLILARLNLCIIMNVSLVELHNS